MNADSAFENGQIQVESLIPSSGVECAWWIKNGRFVEFQLIFTSTSVINAEATVASGLPKPVMAGTYTCLGSIAKCIINDEYTALDDDGKIILVEDIPANTRTVLHGVYVATE